MGQTQTRRNPHPIGHPPGVFTLFGKPPRDPLMGIQKQVQRGSKDPTTAEKFFGAPLRNQNEIRQIVDAWRGDIVKEVNFSIERMEGSSSTPQVIQNGIKRTYLSAMKMKVFFDRSKRQDGMMGITPALYNKIKEMIPVERKLNKTNVTRVGGVPTQKNTEEFQEYDTKMTILMLQAKQQLAQLLMTKTSAVAGLKDALAREERKYQERLQGFRTGWIIGTAFVVVKQEIERILNSPSMRKIFLKTLALPLSLIPVIGPLISRVLNAAAVDMNFDLGDFLREVFAHGIGTVLKLMAQSAVGAVLPPGLSQGLRSVATAGAGLVAREIGAAGAKKVVRDVGKHTTKMNDDMKKSAREVAG